MPKRLVCFLLLACAAGACWAQAPGNSGTSGAEPAASAGELGGLPRAQGQVWREYDLTPYTSKITSTERPEQAVIDWILRETGTEVWFTAPLGVLSADRQSLKVYHTPQMQRVVQGVVERFTASEGQAHLLGVRLVTVTSPNWRGKGHALLRPLSVQTPGIEAWVASRENAAMLLAELKKRPDFREHNSPTMAVPNGQSQTVARTRPRTYLRQAAVDPARPGIEVEQAQIDEGFSLQLSPLVSPDGQIIDAVIKCQIDQVERLLPVMLEPVGGAPTLPRAQVQVPQLASWRLHERFRWPTDQVIVLSCGVVAPPAVEKAPALGVLAAPAGRADALVFVEYVGKADRALVEAARAAGENRGRY